MKGDEPAETLVVLRWAVDSAKDLWIQEEPNGKWKPLLQSEQYELSTERGHVWEDIVELYSARIISEADAFELMKAEKGGGKW